MIARFVLPLIACSALVAPLRADVPASLAETAQARAARYYAAGLELPLLQLRRGASLLEACSGRLRPACTKRQRNLAANNHTITLLDELTLFPERPAQDPVAGVTRAAELSDKITVTSAALLISANDFTRFLIARYGAVLRVCSSEDERAAYRQALDALTAAELQQFQGLAGPRYDEAVAAIDVVETQAAQTLRGMSEGDCDAALTVGHLLMELLNSKLETWSREERRVSNPERAYDFDAALQPALVAAPPPELAHSMAGSFVTVVATELQLAVFPETAPRIKAIAVSEGIPDSG